MTDDPHDLDRFVAAQVGTYDRALQELKAGAKRSHWMWFIFPQIAGLGHSEMARRYAITGPGEATAYLQHPMLGPRLEACAAALLPWANRSARDIMGSPDDMKLRSSMTLFVYVAPELAPAREVFTQVLDAFFQGAADERTLKLMADGL